MAEKFSFQMQFNVNFERATATFDFAQDDSLTLYEDGGEPRKIEIGSEIGYKNEIAYFIDCIKNGRPPQIVTLQNAADAVKIIEAEGRSGHTGATETLTV